MSEKSEAWMRIVVGVISGIILSLWKSLVFALAILNFIYTIFSGKRHKGLAEFCNLWTTQAYRFIRYMTFATKSRPFPFSDMGNAIHPLDIQERKSKKRQ